MVSFRYLTCAVLVALSSHTAAYRPIMSKCGWVGCKYEPDRVLYQQPSTAKTTAPQPAKVVALINKITRKSQALQAPAASLNIINGPLVIAGLGPIPQLITGFVDIVATATTGLASVEDMSPVEHEEQADLIFEAFRDFVRVHQALLSILIGRGGLFITVPFVGAPVAAVLRQIEIVVDLLAFLLIDIAQSRATEIQGLAASLTITIDTTVKTYSGIL